MAQARAQLGEPAAGLADGAVIERAVNAYLLPRMVDATQAAAGPSEEEAERVAYEELAASRRERRSSVRSASSSIRASSDPRTTISWRSRTQLRPT